LQRLRLQTVVEKSIVEKKKKKLTIAACYRVTQVGNIFIDCYFHEMLNSDRINADPHQIHLDYNLNADAE